MKWRVIDTADAGEWHKTLRLFEEADAYFLPEYHHAYELNGDGRALAFVFEEDGSTLFYPFVLRRIERVGSKSLDGSLYDIETVYGYSGPLSTTTDVEFLRVAWRTFSAWCHERRVVAEFMRFNPLSGNFRCVDESCQVSQNRETVAVHLDCSAAELWRAYPAVQRNMVRKALRKGLACKETDPGEVLSHFKDLYRKSMDHVGARAYYYFSDPYFDFLCKGCKAWVKAFVVWTGGEILAVGLFLVHGDRIHYHLAAGAVEYRDAAPNNLLLHTVSEWGRERGFRWLHLGGGQMSNGEDTLFRFKASISRSRLPFHTGRRIQDQRAYDQLCSEWMRQNDVREQPAYFLLYRREGGK